MGIPPRLDYYLSLGEEDCQQDCLRCIAVLLSRAPDSVQKVMDLAAAGQIDLITDAEVVGLQAREGGTSGVRPDTTPPLGDVVRNGRSLYSTLWTHVQPGADCRLGLDIEKNAVKVDTSIMLPVGRVFMLLAISALIRVNLS